MSSLGSRHDSLPTEVSHGSGHGTEPLPPAGQLPRLPLTVRIHTKLRTRFPYEFLQVSFAEDRHRAA